jgi:uncharacterized membrane protein
MTDSTRRVRFLDAWRGLAVLVMLFWHLAWDLAEFGVFPKQAMFDPPMAALRYFIIGSFVLLSGISCRYSRSNTRRGMKTLLCALAVSAAMYCVNDPVWFGTLHLLGCCMLFYAAFGERFEKLPPAKTALVCMVLFTFFLVLTDRVRVTTPVLWAFGFRTRQFYSADYYPLLPWLFLFLTGTIIGGKLQPGVLDVGRSFPGWLCRIGQRALWIYMLHQPVLMGILYLVFFKRPAA